MTPQRMNRDEHAVTTPRSNIGEHFVTPPRVIRNEHAVTPQRTNPNMQLVSSPRTEEAVHGTQFAGAPSSEGVTVYAAGTRIFNRTDAGRVGYGVYFGPDDPNNISRLFEGDKAMTRVNMTAVEHGLRVALEKKIVCSNTNSTSTPIAPYVTLHPCCPCSNLLVLRSTTSKG